MVSEIKDKFSSLFGAEPIFTLSANGRANIIGEHTDYHYGYVFPFSIDKGIVFCGRKSNTLRIFSANFNSFYTLGEVYQKGSWQSYINNGIGFIEAKFNIDISIDLVFGGNLPIGAGVSSSSALCCGLIEMVNQLYDLQIPQIEKVNLASQIEHGTGVIGGKMDQYTIFFGKENRALIMDCRDLSHEDIAVPIQWSFLLINSGVKHNLAHTEYNDRRKDGESALAILQQKLPHLNSLRDLKIDELDTHKDMLSVKQYNRTMHVLNENNRVLMFKNAMLNEDIQTCGNLLNDSHQSLRELYEVSCDELDTLQSLAMQSSFIAGSRMMGGGFGGCTINLITKIDDNEIDDILLKFKNIYGYYPEVYAVKPSSGIIINE